MIYRCESETDAHWERYGARGITVCEEWHDFEVFHAWAVENGYTKGMQLHRIDNNGEYSPSNVKVIEKREHALIHA